MTILNYISLFSSLLPFLLGLVFYRRLGLELKVLLVLFTIVVTIEALGVWFRFNGIDIFWLYHLYTLIEFSLLMLLFSFVQKNHHLKTGLRLSIPIFAFIWLIAKLSIEEFDQIDNYTSALAGFLLIGVSYLTLLELTRGKLEFIFRIPIFWVGVAVLIYFTGNLMTFAFGNMLVTNILLNSPFHPVLNITANLCYAGAFLCLHSR